MQWRQQMILKRARALSWPACDHPQTAVPPRPTLRKEEQKKRRKKKNPKKSGMDQGVTQLNGLQEDQGGRRSDDTFGKFSGSESQGWQTVIISTLASPYLTISWNLTTYSTEGAWVGVTDSKGQPRSNTKGNQVNVHRVNHSQFSSQTCSQVTKVSSTAALANLIYFWFKRWGNRMRCLLRWNWNPSIGYWENGEPCLSLWRLPASGQSGHQIPSSRELSTPL